jgi:HAD superfamily hydrolase (TIGR01490 family)
MAGKSKAAVFSDLEGTLVDGSLPRMSLAEGSKLGFFSPWQKAQFYFFGVLGEIAPGKLKQTVRLAAIKRAMAGQRSQNVGRLVEAVVPQAMALVKPSMLARLKAHQAEGMPLFLLSAGLHELVQAIAVELGGRGEGTRYIEHDGIYQAGLDGLACQGEGKAARALAICTEMGLDPAQCYAYGDTINDLPFLAMFGHPHAVDPDAGLAEEAKRRGWPVVRGA